MRYKLLREFPAEREVIDGALLYATVGRDRRKLDMSYVQDVRRACEEMQRLSRG